MYLNFDRYRFSKFEIENFQIFSHIDSFVLHSPKLWDFCQLSLYVLSKLILLYSLRFNHRTNFLRPGLLSTLFHGIFLKIIQRIIADKLRIHPLLSVRVLGIQNSFHVMKCTKVGKQPTAYGPNQGHHHLFLQVKSYWNTAMLIC